MVQPKLSRNRLGLRRGLNKALSDRKRLEGPLIKETAAHIKEVGVQRAVFHSLVNMYGKAKANQLMAEDIRNLESTKQKLEPKLQRLDKILKRIPIKVAARKKGSTGKLRMIGAYSLVAQRAIKRARSKNAKGSISRDIARIRSL